MLNVYERLMRKTMQWGFGDFVEILKNKLSISSQLFDCKLLAHPLLHDLHLLWRLMSMKNYFD